MSNEKNPEVVGCDASIMKNVWVIREREYELKLQQEEERKEKSALPAINKDWAGRLAARQGGFTRVEKKAKPVETKIDNDNVWKSKLPEAPPTRPRGVGSGPLTKSGGQKDKKGQDKNFKRLQSLMIITQTQPSPMVWGKSWKYDKSLPLPVEGAVSDWGQCWMFATQQPYSEPGKPWLNGPNLMEPHNLHLWEKLDSRMVESEELDLNLPTEEWEMSWRKPVRSKKEDASSVNGENDAKFGFFTSLVETQHRNEALCSSEWNDSWRATKPESQDDFIAQNDDLMNESIAKKQDKDREMSSKWEECWRLVNHLGCNKTKLPQVKKSHNPEWVNSWRANMVVLNNQKNTNPSLRQDDNYDDRSQQRESHLHKDLLVLFEQKQHTDLYMQIYNEFKALSEWSKSWQVTKNNSKPCEELENVLKASTPRLETAFEAQKVENNSKKHYSTSEGVDSCNEQLRHNVIYRPKREFTQSQLLHLKNLENIWSASEWRDSWKTLKHRLRMERRRMRPDRLRIFRGSERGSDMRPISSEWKDSWRFNCQTLHQDPETWQQHWPTTPQIRVDRAWEHNHFAPVELPKNGPTGERSWAESWRSMRHQQGQTSQARSSVASHHPDNSWAQRRYDRPGSDWQEAWMVSETEFHHDRPSLTQWRQAWRSTFFHTERWTEQVPRENDMYVSMEIQPQREISLQRANGKMSRSFDSQMFRERYPEKQWNASWKAESLLKNQLSHYGSSDIPGKSSGNITQQHHTTENGHGSKWGKSFRIANPMPQMEQPWVESSPNLCHYAVMWSKGQKIHNNINTNFSSDPTIFKIWRNSHQFLQGVSAQIRHKTMSKDPVDPWVILMNEIKTRMHLYNNIEKEKQSEKKCAGGHLLAKTQPRPKKGSAPTKNVKMENKTSDKFFEEWAGSWKLLVQPGDLKRTVKSLSGWNESWKFLIPPYPPTNGHKA